MDGENKLADCRYRMVDKSTDAEQQATCTFKNKI